MNADAADMFGRRCVRRICGKSIPTDDFSMNEGALSDNGINEWPADVLARKVVACFLYQLVVGR